MNITRTAVVTDPLARANVMQVLAGPGAPAGMVACVHDGDTVRYTFDDERTAPDVVEALVAIAARAVPARSAGVADRQHVVAQAARGLNEPELDLSRIIETYLP